MLLFYVNPQLLIISLKMNKDNLRDGRVKNWFYLENDLLDRQDLTIYEKMIYIVIARYVDKEDKAFLSY